jgi:hypothetical protein
MELDPATLFEKKIQLRRRPWSRTHKDKEKRKATEEFAGNNTRGSLGCWEDMGRN